jgi:hypothetical protein
MVGIDMELTRILIRDALFVLLQESLFRSSIEYLCHLAPFSVLDNVVFAYRQDMVEKDETVSS